MRILKIALGKTSLVITRDESKCEQVEFDSGFSDEKLAGSECCYKLLAGLYREGYKLASTFTAGEAVATLLSAKER